MKVTERYVLFYGGVFSQWFDCEFQDKNGLKFSSTEQFMMYHKAKVFEDEASMKKIMNESSPKVIKALGREVQGYDDKIWKKVAKDIVTLGNYYKFSQDDKLTGDILKYPNKQFVEASPYDKRWGIGLATNDPRALDADHWLGLNWLGECIDKARIIIDNENNHSIIELLEGIIYGRNED